MRVTTKGRYALRSVIALAKMSQENKPVSIKTISEKEGISPEFLEQIFFKLRREGLIKSVRGPGGGFFLAKTVHEISLKDIIDASGEGIGIAPCVCGKAGGCDRDKDCLAGPVWHALGEHIDNYLKNISLASMIDQA